MRTTIRLDDQLLTEAKLLAASTGRSLTSVIEDALREMLARRQKSGRQEPIKLKTVPGKLLPGIDLDDSAALLDIMEQNDGPARR
ncbi:MAG: DUF2191 domain-containing protein [SAR202 cluster bacterium Io17-Chloro-G4]|nr:MAG: DUF2191 domain-containing protein [SAR202 cluster bacterium Io17-Chloro-G4]